MAQDNFDELKSLLIELLTNRFAPKPEYTRGLLGDGLGNVVVPGKPDKNYVRFNRGSTEYFEVFNVNVPAVEDWPVLIGELPWLPGLTQVVGTDWAAYEQSGWGDNLGATSPHAPTHEWPDGSPGADPVNVYLRSIVPLRAYSLGTGSTTIYVNSYEYENTNGSGTIWGGLPGVDMQPVMTGLATGTARLMGIYLNPGTNALGVVTGVTDIFTDASDPPLPDFPRGVIPVARVRAYGGQASIGEVDIRDARRPFGWTSTGTAGAGGGWPYDDIITVDPTNANANYATLANAITNATAGQTILFDGTHGDITLNKAVTLQGINPETAILNSLTVSTTGTIRDFQVSNTDTNASNYAVTFSAAILAENVKARAVGAGAGGTNAGWRQTGGNAAILRNCQGIGSGNNTNNYGFLADGNSSATIERGTYDGQADGTFEADITSTVTGSSITLAGPQFANNKLRITGHVQGTAIDSYGRDAGTLVSNGSGAQADPGNVGYIDANGDYNQSSTNADVVPWAVVTVGEAAINKPVFVRDEDIAVVNYVGTAPSNGDFLIISTTAGFAQRVTSFQPAIFARCLAAGSGGKVEVLLLTKSPTVPYSSSNPLQQSPVLVGDSIWTGTINGAPSGTTVGYTTSTGDENWLDAVSSSAIAKLRLYNVTRDEYALISDANVSVNDIYLTASVPGTWANTDSLTIASQVNTDTSGGASFLDYEITGEIPELARAMVVDLHWFDSGANGQRVELHPWETYSGSKSFFLNSNTSTILARTVVLPLIQRRYTVRANASGAGTSLVNVYAMGYILAGA